MKPLEELNIPAKTLAAAEQPLPGAIKSEARDDFAGLRGGRRRRHRQRHRHRRRGGVRTRVTASVAAPAAASTGRAAASRRRECCEEKKPSYTADAMRAKVQGTVWLECIVMPDGTVGDVRVTRSLDSVFGLDQEAIKAARQWKFVPGMREGEPVPVLITIELTFTLRCSRSGPRFRSSKSVKFEVHGSRPGTGA